MGSTIFSSGIITGMKNPNTLDQASLLAHVQFLTQADGDLARVVEMYGPPPLWDRPPGFGTLLYIILEQQVSLASARAAYSRLVSAANPLTPEAFLGMEDETLKAIGFSRQKIRYGRGLAQALLDGHLNLEGLAEEEDEAVVAELVQLKGIGRWSAEIYLMEALLRPDRWPVGDLALAKAVRQVKRLEETPSPDRLAELGEAYRPWRSVAARIFWHHYLSSPTPRQQGRTRTKESKAGVQ